MIVKQSSPSFETLLQLSRHDKEPITSGCPESVLRRVCRQAKATLHAALPKGYVDFLRRMNGYRAFSLVLYAAEAVKITVNPTYTYWIPGVIDENELHAMYGNDFYPEWIILGELDEELLLYDTLEQRYKHIGRDCTSNVYGVSKHFWAMIESAIKELVIGYASDVMHDA